MKIQILLVILWLSVINCHESSSNESHYSHHSHKHAFTEEFYWGTLKFKFPNSSAKNTALRTGSYVPTKNVIWSVKVWKDKIFVAVFRAYVGVLSSFCYFSEKSASKSPRLIPYPSFDANYVNEDPAQATVMPRSNSSIINAAYFRIDKYDRLWIPDIGIVNFFGQPRSLTQPALLIFDLNTNILLRRYTIPEEYVDSNTFFSNLEIDFRGSGCDNAYAYIIDMFRSIVVYSFKENRSWRLMHNLLGSDPHQASYKFRGVSYQWNFGVLGITVGKQRHDRSRRVYINPFASTKSYYISNKVLQNETYLALGNYYYDVHLLGDRGKKGQMFTWAYDEETGALFDTEWYRRRIGCWNTANPYKNRNFAVVLKRKRVFFPVDVSIDRHRNLWIVSNNLPYFLYGPFNKNLKNFRIFKANIDDVISDTVCAPG